LLGAVIFAFALATTGLASAGPLGQAGTGTITGQVLSLDDVALPNVHLAAFNQDPSTPNRTPLSEFQSDDQGRYSVQVPAGTVWVEVSTQVINGQPFWGYSNLPVNVAEGQTVSGQDFRIAIRVLSGPEPEPVVEPVGMPRTGAGTDPVPTLALFGGFAMLILGLGLALRRRALR